MRLFVTRGLFPPMSANPDDDPDLVRRAQAGDFSAFETLVVRHERRLFTTAFRIVRQTHDAEEVVQQTFVSAIEHIGSFREEASFATWIGRIATNHALALLRKRSRRTVPLAEDQSREEYSDLPHPEFIAEWAETPDEIAARRETRQLLDKALDELDEKYRLVFVLRDVEGLSTEETAAALAISVSNVKVRLMRARLMLRERLTRLFGDEAKRVEPHAHE